MWVLSFLGRTVRWHGRFRVDREGKLHPLPALEPLLSARPSSSRLA